MEEFWIALGSIAAVVLVVLGILTILAGRRDRRKDSARDAASRAPSLWVRAENGYSGSPRDVVIQATAGNDGEATAREVFVEVLIDGDGVARSESVDLAPGESQTVPVSVPRQFVTALSGDAPTYSGTFGLRAHARGGLSATYP